MCSQEPHHETQEEFEKRMALLYLKRYSAQQAACDISPRSEQVMVDMIREDLGITIEPQAWRMFIRHRWGRITPLAHRIHDGKR